MQSRLSGPEITELKSFIYWKKPFKNHSADEQQEPDLIRVQYKMNRK